MQKAKLVYGAFLIAFLLYFLFGFEHVEGAAHSLVASGYNCTINRSHYSGPTYLMEALPLSTPMLQYVLQPWLNPKPTLIQLYNKYYPTFCSYLVFP
ncbi:MAG: hypothetical protein QXI95_02745 [Candidatus Micrarchaeaceae archaeon]